MTERMPKEGGRSIGAAKVRAVALCLAGLACYWPLIRRSTYQAAFSQEGFFLVFSLSAVAAALIVVALVEPLRRAAEHRFAVLLVLPFGSTALGAAMALGRGGAAGEWLWLAAAVLYGATFAVLTALWGRRLCACPAREACVLVLASFSLGVVLTLAGSLASEASAFMAVLFPLASGVLVWAVGRPPVEGALSELGWRPSNASEDPEASSQGGSHGRPSEALGVERASQQRETVSLISLFVLFLMAGSVVRGFYVGSMEGSAFQHMAQMDGLTLLFCLIIALVILYGKREGPQQRAFLKVWMILSVAFFVGLLLAMMVGQDGRRWGDELALVARMLLSLLLWMVLLFASLGNRQPEIMMSLWVIAEVASSLVAYYIVPTALSQAAASIDFAALNAVLTLVLFTVLLTASFFFLQRIIVGLERDRVVRVLDDSVQRRCALIAKRRGLSSRELEIMVLYAQGSSAKSIGEELFISPDTVRTHIKSIYDKVGVHKKQELIDAVRAAGE